MNPGASRKLLALTSILEFGTGIAVIVVPALVVRMLLGFEISADGTLLARCFGVALLALSLACWPSTSVENWAAIRGMLVYNASIASYLGYLGAFEHVYGALLWPGAVLHAIVAMLLISTTRKRID